MGRCERTKSGGYIDFEGFYNKVVRSGACSNMTIVGMHTFYDSLERILQFIPTPETESKGSLAKTIFYYRYVEGYSLPAIGEFIDKSKGYVEYWLKKFINTVFIPTVKEKILINPQCWGVFIDLTGPQLDALQPIFRSGKLYSYNVVDFCDLMSSQEFTTPASRAKRLLDEIGFYDKVNTQSLGNACMSTFKYIKRKLNDDELPLKVAYLNPNIIFDDLEYMRAALVND